MRPLHPPDANWISGIHQLKLTHAALSSRLALSFSLFSFIYLHFHPSVLEKLHGYSRRGTGIGTGDARNVAIFLFPDNVTR